MFLTLRIRLRISRVLGNALLLVWQVRNMFGSEEEIASLRQEHLFASKKQNI